MSKKTKRNELYSRLYAEEKLLLDANEALWEAESCADVTRAEIAQRLDFSRSSVTNVFTRGPISLRTLARVLWAMGFELELKLRRRPKDRP